MRQGNRIGGEGRGGKVREGGHPPLIPHSSLHTLHSLFITPHSSEGRGREGRRGGGVYGTGWKRRGWKGREWKGRAGKKRIGKGGEVIVHSLPTPHSILLTSHSSFRTPYSSEGME